MSCIKLWLRQIIKNKIHSGTVAINHLPAGLLLVSVRTIQFVVLVRPIFKLPVWRRHATPSHGKQATTPQRVSSVLHDVQYHVPYHVHVEYTTRLPRHGNATFVNLSLVCLLPQ